MVSPEEENTVPDSPMNRGTESDLLLQTCHWTPPPPAETRGIGGALTPCVARAVGD